MATARRSAAAGTLCLLLAGCLAPPSLSLVEQPTGAPDAVRGVLSTEPGETAEAIRILFVHGMGADPRNACLPISLLQHLAHALDVAPRDAAAGPVGCGPLAVPQPIAITVPGAPDPAKLYRYALASADGKRTLDFWFLLWAPLTEPWKETKSLTEQGHPPWALATGLVKDFLRTHLADVVLYGGTYRTVMRAAVQTALCYVVDGDPDPADPHNCRNGNADQRTVLITHSLGGYMLMDAIADLREAHDAARRAAGRDPTVPSQRDAGAKLLARADLIFMLANQLAQLDLTTETAYPPTPPSPENPRSGRMLRRFVGHWRAAHDDTGPKRRRQIVAISDPNDILSYEISAGAIDASKGTTIANGTRSRTSWWAIHSRTLVTYAMNSASL